VEKEQTEAFKTLKDILCSEPLLQYPDFKKEFFVTCDAISTGLRSILNQGPLCHILPLAYASRELAKAERIYSTIEKGTDGVCLRLQAILAVHTRQENSQF
jgi:hypothetical protein